jgi:rfaE bifunctional protein nucleotidyltransferase chain/domain
MKSASMVLRDAEAVRLALAPLRAQGKRIVTTNGCFDILHAGHIQYLAEAAALGDVLVVGINSDAVVRGLKGTGRPIQSEQDRVTIMGSLRIVDFAFIFHEDDPRAFLEIIQPDIHVKGGDYTTDILERGVVEAHGGRVSIVSFRQGYSTTRVVERIRSAAPSPAGP